MPKYSVDAIINYPEGEGKYYSSLSLENTLVYIEALLTGQPEATSFQIIIVPLKSKPE